MPKIFEPAVIAAALFAAIGASLARADDASGQPVMFGKGEPASVEDLPPGPVRQRLESLRPPARERALQWLQRLEFPAADLDALRIDDEGGVLYVEPMPLPGQNPG